MKKTIFTFCSVIALCAVIFLACSKDDTKGSKQVTYASQPYASSGGSGGNPNPNNYPSSTGYTTSGTTTSTTATTTTTGCTKTMTYDGVACTSVTSSISGSTLSFGANCTTIFISFPGSSAPTSGSYACVTSSLTSGQCNFNNVGTYATGGSVTITTGSPNKCSFSNIVVGTHTISGTACY